ncbi:TetR family transcriptional regulator [Citromicrobium bathyomarinum]
MIAAALALLGEKGSSFTLNDVSQAVALSRATLIQRFENRDGILLQMARQHVAETEAWLRSLSEDPKLNDVTAFLHHIIDAMGTGTDFPTHVALAAIEARDPTLKQLAGKRYALVQAAIADRLTGERGTLLRLRRGLPISVLREAGQQV